MHCIDRAWERYAVRLTATDIRVLEDQIRDGLSVLIRKCTAGGEIHLVRHEETVMIAALAPYREDGIWRISTFLPEEEARPGATQRRIERGRQPRMKRKPKNHQWRKFCQ